MTMMAMPSLLLLLTCNLISNVMPDRAMGLAEASVLVRVTNSVLGAGLAAGSSKAIGNGDNNDDDNTRDASSSGSSSSSSRNLWSNEIILLPTVMTEGAKYNLLSLLCCEIMIMA